MKYQLLYILNLSVENYTATPSCSQSRRHPTDMAKIEAAAPKNRLPLVTTAAHLFTEAGPADRTCSTSLFWARASDTNNASQPRDT